MSHATKTRYPEYRPARLPWLTEIPTHWEEKRLRFALTLGPSRRELDRLPAEAPVSFVPMEAVGEFGAIDLSQEREVGEIGAGYTYFANGDVVIAKITPCFENGKGAVGSGLTNGAALGTTELHVLRPHAELDRQFLYYLTASDRFRKTGAAMMYGAGGQKRVPEEFIKDYFAAFPPIDEQRAIAAFLDRETAKIDALIEKKRQVIASLVDRRETIISHAIAVKADTAYVRLKFWVFAF